MISISELQSSAFNASGAVGSITDNLLLILLVLLFSIIVIAGLKTWDVINKHRNLVKLDELEAKHEKLKRYAAHQKRKALKDAIVMLKPDERSYLYSIWADNSILSRNALFKLNELEDRTTRAERATEVKMIGGKLGGLRKVERKLFEDEKGGGGRR